MKHLHSRKFFLSARQVLGFVSFSVVVIALVGLNTDSRNRYPTDVVSVREKKITTAFVAGVSPLEGAAHQKFNWVTSRIAIAQVHNSQSTSLIGSIDIALDNSPCKNSLNVNVISAKSIQKIQLSSNSRVVSVAIEAAANSKNSVWFETSGLPCFVKDDPRSFFFSVRIQNVSWHQ